MLYVYDVNPPPPASAVVRKKRIVKKHDLVLQGLPKEAENADLVFWDPPYYKKKKEEYGPNSISALPREEYLKVFEDVVAAAANQFAKKGIKKVALLTSNYDDEYIMDIQKKIYLYPPLHKPI